MDYTKMKQSYCELMLPTLVQTVTFSSPFQGHRQCDKWNFWRQFLCGCYLGHQTVSREHVPFLLACSVGLQMLVSSVCLKKGMCHLYLHLCVTLLVTVTLKVWPLPSDFIYLHSDIQVAMVLLRACRQRWLKPMYPLWYIFPYENPGMKGLLCT